MTDGKLPWTKPELIELTSTWDDEINVEVEIIVDDEGAKFIKGCATGLLLSVPLWLLLYGLMRLLASWGGGW